MAMEGILFGLSRRSNSVSLEGMTFEAADAGLLNRLLPTEQIDVGSGLLWSPVVVSDDGCEWRCLYEQRC
ncbi:hypothetical protein L1987_09825 [Smallanthus sonchifolius]|uniref:Uncharacterized protein n=1 Tax=Smallanthus sonchifolius TaxID=185202 RepID=A0ACB9JQE6_9ASTR|nr:hypothetical protein L1987_09825 [Smallanthus sonchifolius]